MGQTLEHGVYLPDEGERNCYSGLAANWQILDNSVGTIAAHTAALAGKAPLVHTHGNITNDGKVGTTANKPLITGTDGVVQAGSFGNQANTFCEGNDSRLSDARTPVAHTHTKSDVTDLFNSANTWAEDNTFTKFVKNAPTGLSISENPSSNIDTGFRIVDKDGTIISNLQYTKGTSGNSQIALNIRTKDSNNVVVNRSVCLNTDQYGTWYDFRPSVNNVISLGSSSNQWKSVYAKSYYYNGVAWGLDKQNEWTNFQRMTNNPAVWYLRNNTVTLGTTPSSNRYLGMFFEDVNGAELGNVFFQAAKNGYHSITLSLRNSDGTNTYVGVLRYRASTAGAYCFFPENSECDLGISTNKWKTLNGINPGALSLPDTSAFQSISTTRLLVDGSTQNVPNTQNLFDNGVALQNGWLQIRIPEGSNNWVLLSSDSRANHVGLIATAISSSLVTTVTQGLNVYVPIDKGSIPAFIIKMPVNTNISMSFFPCFGHVS